MKQTYPKYARPSMAAEILDVSTQTLRKWASKGLVGYIILPNGHYRYDVTGLIGTMKAKPIKRADKPVARAPEASQPVTVTSAKAGVEAVVQYASAVAASLPADPPMTSAQIEALLQPKSRPQLPDGVEFRSVDDDEPELTMREMDPEPAPKPAPAAKAPPKKAAKAKPVDRDALARQLEAMQAAASAA